MRSSLSSQDARPAPIPTFARATRQWGAGEPSEAVSFQRTRPPRSARSRPRSTTWVEGRGKPFSKTTDGSRFQELLWLFPEPEFGLTIDIGHALQAGIPPEGLLKMDRIRHFHLHENDRTIDNHQPITTHLEWWEKLFKTLTKKFPDAYGILEMSQFTDQIASLKELQPFLGKRALPKPGKGQMIPPLIVD